MSSMTNETRSEELPLRLAIQTPLLPGDSMEEKFTHARRYGFDAVEIAIGPEYDLDDHLVEVQSAIANTGIPVAAICTHPIHDPMEGDAAERSQRLQTLRHLIALADEIGASGVVSVPVRSRSALSIAPSLDAAIEEMTEAFVDAISALEFAEGTASLFLEPLNRYESWFLNRVGQAVTLAHQINSPRVQALADIFHMNIEESNLSKPLRAAGTKLGHVHVADNNRFEPGVGCLDFRPFFRGLQDISYSGFVSIECYSPRGPIVSGSPDDVLPPSVHFMRGAWAEAQRA